MHAHNQRNLVSILKIATVYLLLVVGLSLLPGKIPGEMVRENGPVETLSAAGYFLFCIFIFYFNFTGVIRTSLAPALFLLLLGLRELDFHARFTTMSMSKIKFFVSPAVPITEKAVVGFFIFVLLAYGFFYLRKALPDFMKDLVGGRPYAVSIVCAICCIVLSKSLDGNTKLFELFLPLSWDPRTVSRTMEECMELFIPVFFIRALLQYSGESVRKQSIGTIGAAGEANRL